MCRTLKQHKLSAQPNRPLKKGPTHLNMFRAGVDIALAKVETFVKTQDKQQKIRQKSEQMAINGGSEDSARLTKREHIAALALQGLLANPSHSFRDAASNAVVVADELIAALNYCLPSEPDHEEFSVPIPGDPDYYEG